MKYFVATSQHTNLFGMALSSHAHKQYLNHLVTHHSALAIGTFARPNQHTEMIIFVVEDRHKLNPLVAADPYAANGLVSESTIKEWQPTIGSLEKPAEAASADSKYFIVTYDISDKVNLAPKKGAHKTYLKKLAKAQQLRAGGAYAGTGTEQQGMYILTVGNRDEAQKLAAADPYLDAESGVYYDINEWTPTLGDF